MKPRIAVSAWLDLSLLLMLVGSVGPWGDIIGNRTVGGWDTSGGPTTLVAVLIFAACAFPAALLPRSPKPVRVPLLSIGLFFALLMAALAVYWAVSIQDLVTSTFGVQGAGWGVWLTAIGSVSALLAIVALLVVTARSPAPAATAAAVGTAAGWYPDPTTPGLQRYWDGSQWTVHTSPG